MKKYLLILRYAALGFIYACFGATIYLFTIGGGFPFHLLTFFTFGAFGIEGVIIGAVFGLFMSFDEGPSSKQQKQ